MTSDETLDKIRALHIPDDRWSCGMLSEPMEHKHLFSGGTVTQVMRCSYDAGHESNHRDAVCCWNFQDFTGGTQGERIDRRVCSCGTYAADCATLAARGDAVQLISRNWESAYRQLVRNLASPPLGWFTLGTHVDRQGITLAFWGDDCGLPIWERPEATS